MNQLLKILSEIKSPMLILSLILGVGVNIIFYTTYVMPQMNDIKSLYVSKEKLNDILTPMSKDISDIKSDINKLTEYFIRTKKF
jgi:hypothetical protein